MDLKGQKPSKNFKDHTGRGRLAKLLDSFFTRLNPIYAYRNAFGAQPQNVNFDRTVPSKNFEDRTGRPKTQDLQNAVLYDIIRNQTTPGDLLLQKDYRSLIVDPILNYAHDPYIRAKKKRK